MDEDERLKKLINSLEEQLENTRNQLTQQQKLQQNKQNYSTNNRESIYQHIFESLVEGVAFLNSKGEVEIINKGAKEISSSSFFEVRDWIRDSRVKVIDENYQPFPIEKQPAVLSLKTKQSVKNVQVGVPIKDEYRWLLVNSHPVFNSDTFLGVVSSFIDVTDLKIQRDELRKAKLDLQISENSLKIAQEISHAGSFIWHLKTDILDWSDELERIYNVTAEPDLQKIISTMLIPEDRQKVTERNILVKQRKKVPPIEYRIKIPNGSIRTLWSNLSEIIYDDEGNPDIVIGVVIDITDRKREEERKLFEQANQQTLRLDSLRFLAGGIAHDFNNLLGGIYGYIDLGLKESNEPVVQNYLKNALKSMTRARSLTDQLLTFTKSGLPNREISQIDKLVFETTNFVLSGIAITCEFSIADDLWYCSIDKGQIAQVIENIVLNAVQSMQRKGILYVAAENIIINDPQPSSKYVKISIKDTGTGMSKETLDHIYEPFFTTKKDGHGLGLATSYSIIKNHEGMIKVDSVINEGSIFSVFLPATEENYVKRKKSKKSNHRGKGLILVLDDEEDIRNILQINLESFGYSVITKNSGEEILDVLKNKETDDSLIGIFLDMTIPGGLGGKELIQNLREKYKTLPIFVISGYSEDQIITKPEKYGFTASLKKPFTKDDLERILKHNIKQK